jgi:hypothetical protein
MRTAKTLDAKRTLSASDSIRAPLDRASENNARDPSGRVRTGRGRERERGVVAATASERPEGRDRKTIEDSTSHRARY